MTFLMLRTTFLLALLVFLTEYNNFVSSADIMMNEWSVSLDRRPFPSKNVVVGDSITFKLLGPHDVWIFPSRTCEDKIDKIHVGSRGDGIAKYTFTENDVGRTLFFACNAGSHCQMGQHIEISVYAALDRIPWNADYDVDITPDGDDSAFEENMMMTVASLSTLASTFMVLW
jgi:hypothetical protein